MKNLRIPSLVLCNPVFLSVPLILAGLCINTQPALALPATTTSLTVTSGGSEVSSVAAGGVVTLTATVTSGDTSLTKGQVNFCDAAAASCTDIHLLATAQLTSAGTAVFKFIPGIGSHNYKAVFLGTNSDAASASSPAELTVTPPATKIPSTTTFTRSGTAADYTFQTTVSSIAGLATPFTAETVSFLDTNHGNQVVATAEPGPVTTVISWPKQTPVSAASFVTVGDFNNDGKPDLIVVTGSNGNQEREILFGNGDGTFTPGPTLGYHFPLNLVGDFNGDGNLDLIESPNAVLLGNGDGTFSPVTSTAVSAYYPILAIADFNHDGIPDLATAVTSGIRVLFGNGDGTFTNGPGFVLGINTEVTSGVVGDFNGDGRPDIAVGTSAHMIILFGNGDGTFTKGPNVPLQAPFGPAVVADFNEDGKADLAIEANPGGILLGNGDGTFTPASTTITYSAQPLLTGDFNQDGKVDLLIGTEILLGSGDGTFSVSATNPGGFSSYTAPALVADFNGDGISDFVGTAYVDNPRFGYVSVGEVLQLTQVTQSASGTATGVSIASGPAHLVEASYPGDADFASSTSGPLALGPPYAAILPPSVAFGNQAVNTSSPVQTASLANIGGDPLTVSNIAITGADQTSFASSNNCRSALGAGSACSINLRFNPTALTSYSATLTVTDNALNSPQSAPITGTGVTPQYPAVTLSAGALAFGNHVVNTVSDAQSVTMTNTGGATLNIRSIVVTGASPRSFASSNDCGAQLPAGSSCVVRVRFNPLVAQGASAAVTITDDAAGSPQKILLTGTGVQGSLSLSTNLIAFPNQVVGTSSFAYEATLSNTANTSVAITSIWWAGPNQTSFVTSNNCGTSLAASSSCIIYLRFRPQAAGQAFASVYVSNSASAPLVLQLRGTAGTPPAVALSATSVAFGGQSGHGINEPQTVIMTNTGGSILPIHSIVVLGPDALSFPMSNNCGAGIDAGASCTIRLSFIPATTGSASATVAITDGAANSPQHIALAGTNTPAIASFSATSITFPDQLLNTSSALEGVTLTNTGGAALPITNISIVGEAPAYFAISNYCPSVLNVGAYCSIDVRFTPLQTGVWSATLMITDGAADSPQKISLKGTGVSAPILTLSSTSLYFTQQAGSPSPVQEVTVTNTGSGTAHISSIVLNGSGAASFGTYVGCGATLAVNASCNILFSFDPKSTGTAVAVLIIYSDADNSPQSIHLTGVSN